MPSQWRPLVAIQFAHERRQVFRNGGASGIGKFGPQSSRKRLHEFHRIERDSGQMAHFSAPPSLIVVNMTQSGKVFATGGALFLLIVVLGLNLLLLLEYWLAWLPLRQPQPDLCHVG